MDPTEAILLEEANQDIGKDSKTVYINDIYNLDTNGAISKWARQTGNEAERQTVMD
jgi:hypothetical protein